MFKKILTIILLIISIGCSKESGTISSSSSTTTTTTDAFSNYSDDDIQFIKDYLISNFEDGSWKTNVVGEDNWDDFEADILNVLYEIETYISVSSSESSTSLKTTLVSNADDWDNTINRYNSQYVFNYDTLYSAYTELGNNSDTMTYIANNSASLTEDNYSTIVSSNSTSSTAHYAVAYKILDAALNDSDGTVTELINYNDGDNFFICLYENYALKTKLEYYDVDYVIAEILDDADDKETKITTVENELDELDALESSYTFNTTYDISNIISDVTSYLTELKSNYSSGTYTSTQAETIFEANENIYTAYLGVSTSSGDADVTILQDLFELVFLAQDSGETSILDQIKALSYEHNTYSKLYEIQTELEGYYDLILDSSGNVQTGDYLNYCSVILPVLQGVDLVFSNKTKIETDSINIGTKIIFYK
jgi:hypothetical protein